MSLRKFIITHLALVISLSLIFFYSQALFATPSIAQLDIQLSHQDQGLLSGEKSISVTLFDQNYSTVIWSKNFDSIRFENGYARIPVGPLDTGALDLKDANILLRLDDDSIVIKLHSEFFSLQSAYADKAKGFLTEDAVYIHSPTANTYYLGIGTKTPREKVELKGNLYLSQSGSSLLFSDESKAGDQDSVGKNSLYYVLTGDGQKLYFNSGNFGIGLISPKYKLDLVGSAKFEIPSSTDYTKTLFIKTDKEVVSQAIPTPSYEGYAEYKLAVGLSTPEATVDIRAISSYSFLFQALSENDIGIRVRNNGYFGLGPNSPTALLDILGTESNLKLLSFQAKNNHSIDLSAEGYFSSGPNSGNSLFTLSSTNLPGLRPDLVNIYQSDGSSVFRIDDNGKSSFGNAFKASHQLNAEGLIISSLINEDESQTDESVLIYVPNEKIQKKPLPSKVWEDLHLWVLTNPDEADELKQHIHTYNELTTKVLIGTTIPGASIVRVNGLIESSEKLLFPDSKTQIRGAFYDGTYLGVGIPNPTAILHTVIIDSSNPIFRVDGVNKRSLTIDTNGKIAIGNPKFNSLLEIISTSNSEDALLIEAPSGMDALKVDSAAKVLMGDAAATAKLNIESPNSSLPVFHIETLEMPLRLDGVGNLGVNKIDPEASLDLINEDSAFILVAEAKAGKKLYINSSANLGIRVSNPISKLDVKSTVNNEVIFKVSGSSSTPLLVSSNLMVGVHNASPDAQLDILSPDSTSAILDIKSSSKGFSLNHQGDAIFTGDLSATGTISANSIVLTLTENTGTDLAITTTPKTRKVPDHLFHPAWLEENNILYVNEDKGKIVGIGTKTISATLEINHNGDLLALKGASNKGLFLDKDASLTSSGNISVGESVTVSEATAHYSSKTGDTSFSKLELPQYLSATKISTFAKYLYKGDPILETKEDSFYLFTKNAPVLLSGDKNLFLGQDSGKVVSTGSQNSFLGINSGIKSQGTKDSVFIGFDSGKENTGGEENTYIANSSGKAQTGKYNTIIGFESGLAAASKDNNLFIGHQSGQSNTDETNVFIGKSSGEGNNSSSNVFIGFKSGKSETGANKLYIANADNSALIYGDFGSNKLSIATTTLAKTLTVDGDIKVSDSFVFSDDTSQTTAGNLWIEKAGNPKVLHLEKNSAKLGIGNNAPAHTLDISGKINAIYYYLASKPFFSFNISTNKKALFLGRFSGSTTFGDKNLGLGYASLNSLDSILDTTALGYYSLSDSPTANQVTFTGSYSGAFLKNSGTSNSSYGYASLSGRRYFNNASENISVSLLDDNSIFGSNAVFNISDPIDGSDFFSGNTAFGDSVFLNQDDAATNTQNTIHDIAENTLIGAEIFVFEAKKVLKNTISGADSSRHATFFSLNNSIFGFESGKSLGLKELSSSNTILGASALDGSLGTGENITALGASTIGHGEWGYSTSRLFTHKAHIVLGYGAGYGYDTGETDNLLFISNRKPASGETSTSSALIWGVLSGTDNGNSLMELTINGALYATSYTNTSDKALKKEIQRLGPVLSKLHAVHPVEFEYKDPKISGIKIGVIAQDLEKVFPELVITGSDGYKKVHYFLFNAVLLDAINEQQHRLRELSKKQLLLRQEANDLLSTL